ncbi:MAG: proline dehydrogenase family protein [Fimbriimonadaceae bacterium]
MLSRTLTLKIASLKPVEALVRRSRLFRPVVRRFIAGDTVEEGLKVAEELVDRGFRVSLDLLGENTDSETEAKAATDAYVTMLRKMAASPCMRPLASPEARVPGIGGAGESIPVETANISIKMTQCGLDLSDDLAETNLRRILEAARDVGTFVRVDMEASPYTERTIAIVERVFADHPNVGTVLQAYLHRTPGDLERLLKAGIRVRLVKGAYLEPSTVAITEKPGVDRAFVELSERLLRKGRFAAIATHDEAIVDRLCRYAEESGISASGFEFQMLYGIRRSLQERLLAEGYNVRVYIPLGDSWYPYFSRRLAERPANAVFILRSLFQK